MVVVCSWEEDVHVFTCILQGALVGSGLLLGVLFLVDVVEMFILHFPLSYTFFFYCVCMIPCLTPFYSYLVFFLLACFSFLHPLSTFILHL